MSIAALSDLAKALPTSIDRSRSSQIGNLIKVSANNRTAASSDIAHFTQAAGLQSESLSLRNASLNIAQAGSLIDVADEGLNTLQQGFSQLEQLASRAQQPDVTNAERKELQQKADIILASLKSVTEETQFNQTTLLDGSLSFESEQGARLLLGDTNADALNLQLGDFRPATLLENRTIDFSTAESARESGSALGDASRIVVTGRYGVQALQQRFDIASAALESAIQNQEAARSTLSEADFEGNDTLDILSVIQAQSGVAMLAQSNKLQPGVLDLLNGR